MNKSENIISILGKTNVGKSTLFNLLIKKKISITSVKKNTTMRYIIKKQSFKENKTILIDTPGPIIRYTHQNYNTNKLIYDILKISHLLIIMIEPHNLTSEDFFILELLKKYKQTKLLIINKIDNLINKEQLLPFITKIKTKIKIEHIIPISSKKNINIKALNSEIINSISNKIISQTQIYQTESLNSMTSDIIKETLLEQLDNEIPYTLKFNITNTNLNKTLTLLNIDFITKKNSHKKIIIGKGGTKIKAIINHIHKKTKKLYNNLKNIKINIINKNNH